MSSLQTYLDYQYLKKERQNKLNRIKRFVEDIKGKYGWKLDCAGESNLYIEWNKELKSCPYQEYFERQEIFSAISYPESEAEDNTILVTHISKENIKNEKNFVEEMKSWGEKHYFFIYLQKNGFLYNDDYISIAIIPKFYM